MIVVLTAVQRRRIAALFAILRFARSHLLKGNTFEPRQLFVDHGVVLQLEIQPLRIDKTRVLVCDVVVSEFSLCVFPDQPECLLILHEDIVIEGVASGTHSHECSPVG